MSRSEAGRLGFEIRHDQMLSRPLEEIWQNEDLPNKVKRLLVIEKLGFETNERIYVKGQELYQDLELVISCLQENGFEDMQASTSTSFDFGLTQSPLFKLSQGDSLPDKKAHLAETAEEYKKIFKSQIVKRFGSVVLDDEIEDFFFKDSWFVFYRDHWAENKENMVGGRLFLESRLDKPRSKRDVMEIEAGLGVMGRSVGVESPGYVSYRVGQVRLGVDLFGKKGIEKTGDQISVYQKELEDPQKQLIRNRGINTMIRKTTSDPDFRIKLRALQKLIGSESIVIDWAWDAQKNKLMVFDFNPVYDPEDDEVRFSKVRRRITRVPVKALAQAYGQHLEQMVLGLRYEHHRDQETEPYEVFVRKMGPDVVWLTHPDERAKRMRKMIYHLKDKGESISLEDERLLLTVCYVHDLGELVIDGRGVGDVPGYSKTADDERVEQEIFYKVIERVDEGEGKELMIKAYEEVERDRESRLGKWLAVVEYLGYLENAIKGVEGEKQDRPVNWNKMCGTIVGRPLQWLMDRMDENRYIEKFFKNNKEAVDKIFNEVDKNNLLIVDESRNFEADYKQWFVEAKTRWGGLEI